MTAGNIGRIAVVLLLLVPLVVFQAGREYAPAWLTIQIGGVPVSTWLTTLLFVIMVMLAWRFAKPAGDES